MSAVAAVGLAAGGVALYDYLNSKGQRLTITNNIMTNMSIDAIMNSDSECYQATEGTQAFNITTARADYAARLTTEDSSCLLCQDIIENIKEARTNLEFAAKQNNPNYTIQTASFDILAGKMMTPGSTASTEPSNSIDNVGGCTLPCTDIYVNGVSQSQDFKVNQSCSITTDVSNSFQQQIKGSIASQLKNQEDVIGQLEDAFTSNQESISTSLASSLSSVITNNYQNDLSSIAKSYQKTDITGNSIYVNQLSQSFKTSMVTSLQVTNHLNNRLRQSANYSISQTLLNKNDTIGDISKDFLKIINTYSGMIESITGQILMIVGSIMVIIALIVGTLYIFNKQFHNGLNKRIEAKANPLPKDTNVPKNTNKY
jgi:hypothetical protein